MLSKIVAYQENYAVIPTCRPTLSLSPYHSNLVILTSDLLTSRSLHALPWACDALFLYSLVLLAQAVSF